VLASHGFAANDPVVFSNTGGALPAAITAGTKYFVKTVVNANTFTVSATAGGTAINMATAGTGTHSVTWLYSALSSDAQWQFAQFGNLVFATQKNAVLQVYNLASSTAFALTARALLHKPITSALLAASLCSPGCSRIRSAFIGRA
jgi:hypothetical protein